ncbi:hypothetical protein E1161_06725 [Saccharopolyspora aridisoli]|uniref:PE domain-containing protein n=1 Tax=Saccharopolyspora aridisoli TaxID=2530385 RepID=A0A4R4UZM7_9PSEU|nr:hypothetical protein [Saccharopolyspora aridisoli]TDC94744.1 hypothetical protein E1161_06725 [Saccharopolyspora aridisoli]
MAGFVVDAAGLQSAIKRLEKIRDDALAMVDSAARVEPGELTAKDTYTNKARLAITERAAGETGSLRMTAHDLTKKLQEKIDAYNAVLAEYQAADEHGSDLQRHVAS